MTLYELFEIYILPHIVDLNLFGGIASDVFYRVFVVAVSCILVHCFVVLPYMGLLKLIKYRPTWWWRKR